jgi:hypothetical protein
MYKQGIALIQTCAQLLFCSSASLSAARGQPSLVNGLLLGLRMDYGRPGESPDLATFLFSLSGSSEMGIWRSSICAACVVFLIVCEIF